MSDRIRVLELFAGIGGCAAAIGNRAEIVAAVETDREALAVYRHNFTNLTCDQPVESLPTEWFHQPAADLWWMSPPTLPYIHAGLNRELTDVRSAGLLHIIDQIALVKPPFVALECVKNFGKSLARQMLLKALSNSGYRWQEVELCPTELGAMNKRPRYYLVAGLDELLPWSPKRAEKPFSIRSVLDEVAADELRIAPELLAMHRGTMDVVDANDTSAVTSCFTADYGRSVNRTGSYLKQRDCVRHFSPTEILRQFDFPASFTLPMTTTVETAWRLVGNSLSMPATKMILASVPGLFSRHPRLLRESLSNSQSH